MKATIPIGGHLSRIDGNAFDNNKCYIKIPAPRNSLIPPNQLVPTNTDETLQLINSVYVIYFDILPEVSESRSVAYSDEPIMGRTLPYKTFSHGENTTVSIQIKLFSTNEQKLITNINKLKLIRSISYTEKGDASAPFYPPPICRIRMGSLFFNNEFSAVLKSYNTRAPTDTAWDEKYMFPLKIDIDTSWDVVFKSSSLPDRVKILTL